MPRPLITICKRQILCEPGLSVYRNDPVTYDGQLCGCLTQKATFTAPHRLPDFDRLLISVRKSVTVRIIASFHAVKREKEHGRFQGSELVDHSQKMMEAARATAEKKAVGRQS